MSTTSRRGASRASFAARSRASRHQPPSPTRSDPWPQNRECSIEAPVKDFLSPVFRAGRRTHPAPWGGFMTEPLVYLNGRMLPASEAHLAIYDAGIVLGATVTEMTRTFRKRSWRLDDHLDRLFRSLRYTRMDIGLSPEQLAGISHELVANNAKLLDEDGELGLIHFVTAGEYPTYAGMSGRPARTT